MRDDAIPSVPLIVNNYYEPNKPTVKRCMAFGRAVARAVQSFPATRDRAHRLGRAHHFAIDEELDRKVLAAMQSGDSHDREDSRIGVPVARHRRDQELDPVAAATKELGMKMSLVDYVPCYRSEAAPARRWPSPTGGVGAVTFSRGEKGAFGASAF